MDLKIFVDAAYDYRSRMGSYCIVTVYGEHKDWYVEDFDGSYDSTGAELAGLRAALDICQKIKKSAAIYCDNMSAIRTCQPRAAELGCEIHHFRGHQLGSQDVLIDDDVKAHHWADRMAVSQLHRRLDRLKTRAYNDKRTTVRKET